MPKRGKKQQSGPSLGNITITGENIKDIKISQRDIIETNTAIGSNLDEISKAFENIYRTIGKIPDPEVKEKAENAAKEIEDEIREGDDADPSRVERWLKFLAEIAPDVKGVVIATLENPIKGISEVIRKVVKKAQAQQ